MNNTIVQTSKTCAAPRPAIEARSMVQAMNVIVFGATGHLGRHVTQHALDAGHTVTAFSRNPHRLEMDPPRLHRIAGDAYDADQVSAAVAGQDAVIITLGTGKSRKNTLRSEGTRNVIAGMQQHGVRRLICQTTLGCQETWDSLNFYWKRIMFGAIIKPVFKDHEKQERLTQASDLDWTIIRPSAFKDTAGPGQLHIGFPPTHEGLAFTVSKHEVAEFIVRQLEDQSCLHQAVSISR